MALTVYHRHTAQTSYGSRPYRALKAVLILAAVIVAACTSRNTPIAPSQAGANPALHDAHGMMGSTPSDYNSAAGAQRGYIDGWVDGELVHLYYTKWFFCAEPPSSAATTDCEIGADPEVAPRPGPIPTIFAIAAVGITPDVSTLACRAGTPCLNHPAMIDASRVGGSPTAGAIPHSHILTEKRGGWFQTTNVRVRDLDAWNQIAAAKSLEKVRELQADPNIGGQGLVSADTPTNIYFFIASWR